ncbi:restriction endonuclease subunit S [Francisellaceae bacterium CB300]
MSKYKPYPSYKNSGVEWLGDAPSEWDVTRNKTAFNFKKFLVGENSKDFNLLSLTLNGIILRDMESGKGKFPAEFNTYQKVNKEDLVFCLFDIDETPRTIGISNFNGMITGAYNVVVCNDTTAIPMFIYYYYLAIDYYKGLKPFYTGLRKVVRTETFLNINLALPPLSEQQAIADFLDNATSKIDTLITKQQDLIKLLKEKRQAVISHAVTKGLDPTVEFKDYRLDWVCGVVRGNSSFKKDELLNNGKYVALQYGKTYKIEQVDHSFNFYVNDEFYKLGQIVEYGDTILISTSETVKDLRHSCFYARSDVGLVGGEQILLKPITNTIFDKFLYYSSRFFCPKLGKYSTGLKVFRFSTDDLKNIFLSIPPLSEQQAIANYLDDKTAKIDTLVDKATQSIELLKEKRVAIISSAVTGKIDVRGVV